MTNLTRALVLLLACSGVVLAQNTFTVDRDSPALHLIDTSTGADITVLPLTGTSGNGLTALSVDPTSGTFYAIDGAGSTTGRTLITINPMTGTTTTQGPVADGMASISFDGNGTLYGISGDGGSSGQLFTINTSNGMSSPVAALGAPGGDGDEFAVSPFDGLIYRIDSEALSSIDPNAGFTQTFITTLGIGGISEVVGMAFDASGDILVCDLGSDLFQVTTAGVETLIGPLTHTAQGMDQPGLFGPPVLPNFAGTGEDIITQVSVNNGPYTGVTTALNDTASLVMGDTLAVRHSSPGGTFDFIDLAIFGTFAPNGTAAIEVFPGLHLLNGGTLFAPLTGGVLGQPLLMLPGGVAWGAVHVGGGLTGLSALVQAASLTSTAANGIFAATNGLLLQFN